MIDIYAERIKQLNSENAALQERLDRIAKIVKSTRTYDPNYVTAMTVFQSAQKAFSKILSIAKGDGDDAR